MTQVRLTPQQHRVLSFCAIGMTDPQIAAQMGLCTRTVKFHMLACIQAFNVHSRTAAACRALVWGLLPETVGALQTLRDEEAAL